MAREATRRASQLSRHQEGRVWAMGRAGRRAAQKEEKNAKALR